MSHTVYALLVGIDEYQSPVRPLSGCVRDITTIHEFLQTRVDGDGRGLKVLPLLNLQATLQAVTDGFRQFLTQAGEGDVALFYYAGHGSQAIVPKGLEQLEPDGLVETLVCYDSRQQGKYDLTDKALSALIAEVAERGPHIVAIFDSCHSGTITRALKDDADFSVRRVARDERERPATELELASPRKQTSRAADAADTEVKWVALPSGRHVVISACHSDEEAKETRIGGQRRGVFSYSLVETLQGASETVTYRDLFKRVQALVQTRAQHQKPVIEVSATGDLDQPFLGGAVSKQPPYFTLHHDKQEGWMIDGGAANGIAAPVGEETTVLAIFPIDAGLNEKGDFKGVLGQARVKRVTPASSNVEFSLHDHGRLDESKTYKAVVTATPLPPLDVDLTGDEQGVELARRALATAEPDDKPSLLVREMPGAGELKLMVDAGGYIMRRVADDYPLTVRVDGLTAEGAQKAVAYLEHVARWQRVAQLINPGRRIKPSAVKMELFEVSADGAEKQIDLGREVRLNYQKKDDKWRAPRVRVRLTNTSDEKLFCMLFDVAEDYSITPLMKCEHLESGKPVFANDGKTIKLAIDPELHKQGMVQVRDIFKLIISTEEGDPALLAQEGLKVGFTKSDTRAVPKSAFERLLRRVQTRGVDLSSDDDDLSADWTTSEISITTLWPQEGIDIAAEKELLPGLVTISQNPGLKAKARLISAPQALATRGETTLSLPPLLVDSPGVVQPFLFSSTLAAGTALNVLELTDVDQASLKSITPEQPLQLAVSASLEDHEHVLPVAFDGELELFVPVGRGHKTASGEVEIDIHHLPPPVSTRSLFGAIRIFFQKVVSETFGSKFPYPLIAATGSRGVRLAPALDGPEQVRAQVAQANRILLYIHGIIGDTHGMAASAFAEGFTALPLTKDRYDLILTCDYENLETGIRQTAKQLKEKLAEVGLTAEEVKRRGQTLDIVAHSMGGLVSRWFIERERGKDMVSRLVMLGTPNGGSPLPRVEDWLLTLLTIGINGLAPLSWPAAALGGLTRGLEKIDVMLDEMAVGSEFILELAASPDPGIPYHIIAGNTGLITTAPVGLSERLQRLLLHRGFDLVFLKQPNDVAVSVESISSAPQTRSPRPTVTTVACDHMHYFSTEAGLRALAEALERRL
jgi:pimeloyl-ACP methyl ester carboxylesterase